MAKRQAAFPPFPMEAVVVVCTVCHAMGLLEAEGHPLAVPPLEWPALGCCFTDGCIGHVWPELPN
jgi:hypothetical protein